MTNELTWIEGVLNAVRGQVNIFEFILITAESKNTEGMEEAQLFIKNVCKIQNKILCTYKTCKRSYKMSSSIFVQKVQYLILT